MFPDGGNGNQSNQQATGQPPAQQQAAPPIQQQFQPPPQAQPVHQQQQFQHVPAPMPVIPSPQNLQRPAQPAPVQQQQQPTAPNYDPIVNQVAIALGTTPDVVRQQLGDNLEMGIASLVRDAAGMVYRQRNEQTQVQPVSQQQQQTVSTDGKIPLADGWQNVVQKNSQGVYEAVHPQYKQYADAANHNALVDRQRFERYQQDPTLLVQAPEVQKLIQKQINDAVQAQVHQQQIMGLREEYRNKFAKEITQVDERGVTKMGMDGKPMMTPLGMALAKHVNALAESGMQESRQLYETAMIMARNETGVQNFAANVQQAPMQPQQNMQGQPYYQQQQAQPQYGQPQTMNLASMLQQNAQAYYPGQPPARGPVMQPTIEGALYEMVKDLPDGLTAGQYLDSVGSLFKTGQR